MQTHTEKAIINNNYFYNNITYNTYYLHYNIYNNQRNLSKKHIYTHFYVLRTLKNINYSIRLLFSAPFQINYMII